ncbi:54S ribosomal protein L6 mitochondrial [Entomophthora muscae]|uniref:54S ribosomal protein L6 mitochondrial n=1 Tax=Entomophthora muscae TaxID=34485 RepID=A0ACC2RW86_9FUNG|nr:54S ribosomal protein L6 mitochondrial [Entomophthora muscae]
MLRNKLVFSLGSANRSFTTSALSLSHIGKAPVHFSPDVSITFVPTGGSGPVTIPEFFNHPLSPPVDRRLKSRERSGQLGDAVGTLHVKGPLGEQKVGIHPFVRLEILKELTEAGNHVMEVSVQDNRVKTQKAMWGTTRALINNAITGVTDGFTLPLKLVGVGYRANLEDHDTKIGLKLGYSHPIAVPIPEGIKVVIPQPTRILLSSNDKQLLGQFAAVIRAWRKPEPYNQKGIFVGDEVIKKKEGKKK